MVKQRKRLCSAALAVVVVLCLVVGGPVGRAAADDPLPRSEVSTTVRFQSFTAANKFTVAGLWVACDIAGWWETRGSDGANKLRVTGACSHGWTTTSDYPVRFYADVPGCGRLQTVEVKSGTVGSFEDVMMTDPVSGPFGFSGVGCGAPTQLCVESLGSVVDAAPPGRLSGCKPWDLGAPPEAPDEWYASGSGDCPRGRVLEPWVTAPHPVDLGGGTWRWESEGVLRVDGQTDPNVSLPTWGTAGMYLGAYVMLASGSGTSQVVVADGRGAQWGGAGFAGVGGGMLMDNQSSAPTKVARVTMQWSVRGPTLTTPLGSGVPSFAYRGIGTYPTPSYNIGVNGTRLPYSDTSAVTATTYQSAGAGASSWGGRSDPAHCYTVWGTASTGAATGPLTFQSTPTPPPVVVVITSPPVINVGPLPPGGCPAGETCIDPSDGAPAPPNSLPDPDDSSCDFSITDPSTWGGQLICALVQVAKAIISAVLAVLDGVLGLVTAFGQLLTTLLVPHPSSWGLDGLVDQLNGRAPFSVFGDLALSTGTVVSAYQAGGCSGSSDWDVGGEDVSITCAKLESVPGLVAARTVIGAGLLALTGWTIFGMLAGMVKTE